MAIWRPYYSRNYSYPMSSNQAQVETYKIWVRDTLRYARNGKYGIRIDKLNLIWSGGVTGLRPGPWRASWRMEDLKWAQSLLFKNAPFKLFRRGTSKIKCVKIDAKDPLFRLYYG